MLHLALAGKWSQNHQSGAWLNIHLPGNILCSIGGTPILYRKKTETHAYVPEYPTTMVYQDITLNLKAATKNNIRTFMEVCTCDSEHFSTLTANALAWEARAWVGVWVWYTRKVKRWNLWQYRRLLQGGRVRWIWPILGKELIIDFVRSFEPRTRSHQCFSKPISRRVKR